MAVYAILGIAIGQAYPRTIRGQFIVISVSTEVEQRVRHSATATLNIVGPTTAFNGAPWSMMPGKLWVRLVWISG